MVHQLRLLVPAALAALALSPLLLRSAQTRNAAPAVPVDESALAKTLAEIRPQPGEDAFDTIPWQVSLWEARALAAKEGKPILIWEMDGHPLGCG